MNALAFREVDIIWDVLNASKELKRSAARLMNIDGWYSGPHFSFQMNVPILMMYKVLKS